MISTLICQEHVVPVDVKTEPFTLNRQLPNPYEKLRLAFIQAAWYWIWHKVVLLTCMTITLKENMGGCEQWTEEIWQFRSKVGVYVTACNRKHNLLPLLLTDFHNYQLSFMDNIYELFLLYESRVQYISASCCSYEANFMLVAFQFGTNPDLESYCNAIYPNISL